MQENQLNRIALLGLAAIVMGVLSTHTTVDLDMFHQMALFRETLNLGRIPTEDAFSYVPTVNPMIHHELGTGALLYLATVSSGLGTTGLMVLKYLLSGGVVIGCYLYAKREGANVAVFAPLALVAIILGNVGFGTIRAHLFSLLFLVILLLFLQEDRRGKRWWIVLWLPLDVVWINLHAGFVLGLGLIGFYILERFLGEILDRKSFVAALNKIKHLIAVECAMVCLVVLNPYGFKYIPHLWHALTLDRTHITEWQPIWHPIWGYARVHGIPFLALFITALVYSTLKVKLRDLPHLFFLITTGVLSMLHIRYLSVCAIPGICCIPTFIEKTKVGEVLRNFWTKRKGFLLVFWIIYGALGFCLAIRGQFWRLDIPTTVAEHEKRGVIIYPVGAADYLANEKFKGNVMVPFSAGSYVSWKLYPDVKVSIDSRFEAAYSVEWAVEQRDFYAAKDGWKETLYRYQTDAVLVPHYSPIDKLLDQPLTVPGDVNSVKWQRVYIDDGFSLFMRPEIADRFDVIDNTGKPIVGSFP